MAADCELTVLKEEFPNAYNAEIIDSFTVIGLADGYEVTITFDNDSETIIYPLVMENTVYKLIDELNTCALEGHVNI